jgi:predicted  nucleic acid-binding Zn-ribbon protein
MAGKTPTDKINDLSNLMAALTAKFDVLHEEAKRINTELDKTAEAQSDLRTKFALLEQQVAELKKGKEEWGRRLWAIVGPLVGAVVGGLLGYLLRG